eukprot:27222_1
MGDICSSCTRKNEVMTDRNIDKPSAAAKTRNVMKKYWDEHSQQSPTNSLMLLMKEDEEFAMKEKQEILSYLPSVEGLSVVELGSGVGRFTGDLAKKATTVLAVDFVGKFLNENKKRFNSIYPHIDYLLKDVTKLELDRNSYDIIFSNWLMMYLDDNEVIKLSAKLANWCNVGGYIFFRESCEGGASGDIPRNENPTFYRGHKQYLKIFSEHKNLQLISVNQINIYLKTKNKTNQYCFLYKKINSD